MKHAPHDTPFLPQAVTSERMTVTRYSAEEIIHNFQALLDSLDYKAELGEVGIGILQFTRRTKALREFKALTIALWGLALQRSFPDDAPEFFKAFRQTSPMLNTTGNVAQMLNNRVNIYVDLLAPKKDSDFQPVAQYLAEVLSLTAADTPRLRLKLSLMMRTMYSLIFKNLV